MSRAVTRMSTAVATGLLGATLVATPVSAVADTTPPVIDAITVQPSTPTIYSAVAFSASAHDTESAVTSLSWSFGDGGTGVGANVSHTYTQSGSMTVTVTAVDAAGNASTATTGVLVSMFQTEPSYSEPSLSHVRLRPGTISSAGTTDGVARRTRLSFRVHDDFGPEKVVIVVRALHGGVEAKRVLERVDEGANTVKLGTRVGGERLRPGRYRVIVRAVNDYGSDVGTARLRIVR